MDNKIYFDHIEAHVSNIPAYCEFLVDLFRGGKYKQLNDNGTSMYLHPDGLAIEIKKRADGLEPAKAGFCLPCFRMNNPLEHLKNLGLPIGKSAETPTGMVHFFKDPEGIEWHVKDSAAKDAFVDF